MPFALLSTSNKNGIIELAKGLVELNWTLMATGGTAMKLFQAGIPVEEISNYTNSPEILNGRVKTLHPAVFGGILSRRTLQDEMDIKKIHARPIDMVIVNLYPFDETIQKPSTTYSDAIENIDIGGVALIRAAAKNHEFVTVITDPADYQAILSEIQQYGNTSSSTRQKMAVKAFHHTKTYDSHIASYLEAQVIGFDSDDHPWLTDYPYTPLRYGENPHQSARLYHIGEIKDKNALGGRLLQGKELPYNNLLDLDAAWRAVISFDVPAICIIKHNSPCGIAQCSSQAQSFIQALACDPVSAFGGIIAANSIFESDTAEALSDLFVECVIAPGFSDDALKLLSKKKNCRLIEMSSIESSMKYEFRSIEKGILWQTRDTGDPVDSDAWKVVTRRHPEPHELTSMQFAWKACQHVKSNAIVLSKGNATVGIGGGQPNRVDCIKIAAERAGENVKNSVMASDAFFPFADSIHQAAQIGVTAIVQPGGSIRDSESITAADEHNISMMFTGIRHFRH